MSHPQPGPEKLRESISPRERPDRFYRIENLCSEKTFLAASEVGGDAAKIPAMKRKAYEKIRGRWGRAESDQGAVFNHYERGAENGPASQA